MADISLLHTALRNAHAAGDVESARKIAGYIKAQETSVSEPAFDPTSDMSTGQRVLAGIGKGFVDTGRGIGQLLGAVSKKDIEESRSLDAPLMRTTAGQVGNILGNVAAAVPTFAIPGAASLRGAALIGAGQGLLQPALDGNERLRNTGVGAAAGAGGVVVGRAIGAAAQGARALIDPFTDVGRKKIAGRTLARFASDPNAISSATGQRTITGATPTLAEETGDRGLAQLMDSLRSIDPQIANRFAQRASDNNAARVQALQSLAGDSAERETAELARKTATSDLYKQATTASYTVDSTLSDLLKRPAVRRAMDRAEVLAANKGREAIFDTSPQPAYRTFTNTFGDESKALAAPAVRTTNVTWTGVPKSTKGRPGGVAATVGDASSGINARTVYSNRAGAGEGVLREPRPGSFGAVTRTVDVRGATPGEGVSKRTAQQIDGQSLLDLKLAMDDLLADPTSGFAGKSGNALRDLRNDVVSWMERANPDFKAARDGYAAASKPINGFDVGEEISRRATSNTSDLSGNPRMQANALLGILRDPEKVIRAATGRKELKTLEQVFSPEQITLLRAVAGETDRAAAVASAGAGPGSATAQRMASQNILRQLVGPTGLPESWAESALANTMIGKPFNLIYGGVAEPKIQMTLADALLNPNAAKEAMAVAAPRQPLIPDNLAMQLMLAGYRLTPSSVAMTRER